MVDKLGINFSIRGCFIILTGLLSTLYASMVIFAEKDSKWVIITFPSLWVFPIICSIGSNYSYLGVAFLTLWQNF